VANSRPSATRDSTASRVGAGLSGAGHLYATRPTRELADLRVTPLLVGADDLEVLVDEDVVRPVDADVVDFVLAVAQHDNAVDDAPRLRGQRSVRRVIRCRSVGDRP
jgi:hypothetical protein